jgi:hypothetical protein
MTGPVSVAGLSGGAINDTIEESDVLEDNPGAVEEVEKLVDGNEVDCTVPDWPDDPGDALDAAEVPEDADPGVLWATLSLELDAEVINVGNVLSDDDADAAFDELDIDASLDMEGKEEDTIAVVDLNTPLYVVDTEEDDVEEHTSDEQQGIGVAVVVAVEKAPP